MSRQAKHKSIKKEAQKLFSALKITAENVEVQTYNENQRHINRYADENSEILLDCNSLNTNMDCAPEIVVTNSIFETFKPSQTLKEFLATWSIKHSLSTNATNEFLKFLKEEGHDVPLNVRTLRGTPRYTNIVDKDEGSYLHYGLKNCLTDFLYKNEQILITNGTKQLTLNFGIDGMQLFSSSKRTAWPIMMNISGFSDVFLVGCYINSNVNEILNKSTKPKNADVFMEPFISELKKIMRDGFLYNTVFLTIMIGVFVCDAPARAFILNIKSHSGFYCCTKCTQKGQWFKKRITFPPKEENLRSGTSFATRFTVYSSANVYSFSRTTHTSIILHTLTLAVTDLY